MDPVAPTLARRWWLLPLLLVVAAGSVATNLHREPQIALGIAAGLTLLAIDWWLVAVVVNGVLVGAYFATGGHDGPVFLTVVAATFLASSRVEVRRWLPFVLLGCVAVWAGLVVRGVRQDDFEVNLWQSFGTGALVAAAAAVGTSIRLRQAARRDRLDRAAADEKLRMAHELHDGVGHGLAVIAMQAGVALHVLDQDPAKARVSLEAIRATSVESLEALRAELAAMSGDAPPRRPASGVADLPALYERVRAAGLRLEVRGDPGAMPDDVGEAVYAVVQEALTNVLRHAAAELAVVQLERPAADLVVVTVRDDGRAGAPIASIGTGLGLAGMRARVERLGGRFAAGPVEAPGASGFEVSAELPVRSRVAAS